MEGFYEHIVKKTKTAKEGVYTAGIILAALLIIFFVAPLIGALLKFSFAGTLIQVLTIYGVYYLVTMMNIEYEYALTGSELDVDCITAKRKRKRLVSVDCKKFEILAPVNEGDYLEDYKTYNVLNYAGNKMSQNCYFAAYEQNGVQTCLMFEPTEAMLRGIKKYIHDKVIIDESI